MAGTKTGSRKKATRKVARTKTSTAQAKSAYMRLERDLPPNLRDFSRRVRASLSELEREVGRAQAKGERRWRKLTAPARREAIRLLHRLERTLAMPKRKKSRAA